jgi:hypothetical protein
MKKINLKPVFLIWVLLASLIGVATVFGFTTGLMEEVNKADFTKITFIIYGVFLIFTGLTGKLTYRATKNWESKNEIKKLNNWGWFAASCFSYAGMIGTVIGFIFMMSSSFDNISNANVQTVIVFALGKMGLALYTTASGLISRLLLEIQLFNLQQYLEK